MGTTTSDEKIQTIEENIPKSTPTQKNPVNPNDENRPSSPDTRQLQRPTIPEPTPVQMRTIPPPENPRVSLPDPSPKPQPQKKSDKKDYELDSQLLELGPTRLPQIPPIPRQPIDELLKPEQSFKPSLFLSPSRSQPGASGMLDSQESSPFRAAPKLTSLPYNQTLSNSKKMLLIKDMTILLLNEIKRLATEKQILLDEFDQLLRQKVSKATSEVVNERLLKHFPTLGDDEWKKEILEQSKAKLVQDPELVTLQIGLILQPRDSHQPPLNVTDSIILPPAPDPPPPVQPHPTNPSNVDTDLNLNPPLLPLPQPPLNPQN